MARDQEHIPVGSEWVELTNDDVEEISFQALSGPVYIRRGTVTPPAVDRMGWIFLTGWGRQSIPLENIAHGAGQRVWAKAPNRSLEMVLVDHA